MSAILLGLILFAGLAIGMTGIGGLLVVPGLSVLADMAPTRAVPASTLAFLFTGLAATALVQWQRRAGAANDSSGPGAEAALPPLRGLQLAALLGAGCGAFSLRWLPAAGIHLALAALALLSGLHTLLARAPPDDAATTRLPPARQYGIGLAVGLGSAWSGTGGPILLLPILMGLQIPTRAAIAMAQAVQLPIALSATAINLWAGQLDWRLGAMLGALLLLGWAAGVWLGARLPTARLRQALGWLLLGAGLWYGLHTLRT